jgi:glutamine amidotransferase
MITIVNYGLGNLSSIANMIKRVGGEAEICNDPTKINKASKIILPGVGAFDHGMEGLQAGGWIKELNDAVLQKNIPVLGICLGMQLMCKSSEEGQLPGLGWIDATVNHFNIPPSSDLKVPHMGWNTIAPKKDNLLVAKEEKEQRFYFVHSYHVTCNDTGDILFTTQHGEEVVAAFTRKNIYGVQFHPEKSHRFGMALMQNFINI